jgi:hypothetical protein
MKELMAVARPLGAGTRRLAGVTVRGCSGARNTTTTKEYDMGLFTGSTDYKSDIVLGQKYIDKQTGFEGVATSTTFFQHACERVCLETFDTERKRVIECVFDSPRLTRISTGQVAKTEKTGGPQLPNAQRNPASR